MAIKLEKQMKSQLKSKSSDPYTLACGPTDGKEPLLEHAVDSSRVATEPDMTGFTAVIGRDRKSGFVLSVGMTSVVGKRQ